MSEGTSIGCSEIGRKTESLNAGKRVSLGLALLLLSAANVWNAEVWVTTARAAQAWAAEPASASSPSREVSTLLDQVRAQGERLQGNQQGSLQDNEHATETAGLSGLSIPGFTAARNDVEIGLAESGRIAGVQVREGDQVKKGDTLLFLDKSLEELDVRNRKIRLDDDSDLHFARQRAELLRRQFESSKRLNSNGSVISGDEYEQARINHAQAQAELAQLKTQKKLQKIDLEVAREKYQRRFLTAPVSGIVVKLLKAEGESVQAREPVARLVNATTGRFHGNAETEKVKRLQVDDEVCLELRDAGKTVWRRARISFVSPLVDTASGLAEIQAEFDNSLEPLQLGGTATLRTERSLCKEQKRLQPREHSVLNDQDKPDKAGAEIAYKTTKEHGEQHAEATTNKQEQRLQITAQSRKTRIISPEKKVLIKAGD